MNRIDLVRPDAPEFAAFGDHALGVRTLAFVNPDQLDVIGALANGGAPRYARPLVVEVWYPAAGAAAEPGSQRYDVGTRDPAVRATLRGRARRDAAPLVEGAPRPLVIVSHGYTGNRFLMAHFGEHLASRGYVVASIDHTDSTYADQAAFASTLLNRPLDQLFVLEAMAALAARAGDPLAGIVDASRTAIVGYSMGGYGAINAVGGGFSAASIGYEYAPPNGALRTRQMGEATYLAGRDDRVRAVVAIGPWGMEAGFWDAEGLEALSTPMLLMAGELDDVSGYERGVHAIFAGARNAERTLLTFEGANHNAAAPMPVPIEVAHDPRAFEHHADAVWDTRRMNDVAHHFVAAFLAIHLRGESELAAYFDLVERAVDGVVRLDEGGAPAAGHTHWRGFPARTAAGLRLERRRPA
ncbi:MAG: dienelactone hydrolase [Trueperaceae bacterium]|nr:dienelactone hydrolase [Trueperaceae bacterium]